MIRKVKHDGDTVTIHYTDVRGDYADEIVLESNEQPLQSFRDALQALALEVAEWCELPDEACEDLEIRGVSYTWKHEVMGATVTALRGLRRCASPLVLNCPHKTVEPYSGDDVSCCLSGSQVDALRALEREAERYIAGERAQMELPLEVAADPDDEFPPEPDPDPEPPWAGDDDRAQFPALSDEQRIAVAVLRDGGDPGYAAEQAGVVRKTITRWAKDPEFARACVPQI